MNDENKPHQQLAYKSAESFPGSPPVLLNDSFSQGVDPVMQSRLTPLGTVAQNTANYAHPINPVSIPEGLTQAQISAIAQGTPDPDMPANPSEISPVREMTSGEMHQFVLALEAKMQLLENRFNLLVSENYKKEY